MLLLLFWNEIKRGSTTEMLVIILVMYFKSKKKPFLSLFNLIFEGGGSEMVTMVMFFVHIPKPVVNKKKN